MKVPLLVALAVAASGCTGQTAALLVDHELPDGQAEASPDAPFPEPDAAQEHAGDAGIDDAYTPPPDAGVDARLEASPDVVDEQLDDAGDAAKDGALACDEAGVCRLPDGAVCSLPATDFGCTADTPHDFLCGSQFAAYDCPSATPGCYSAQGIYCCPDTMLCPPQ